MDAPNWRQIVGGSVGVALLGAIGYFGQGRIRTNASPQKSSSAVTKSSKKTEPVATPSASPVEQKGFDRESPNTESDFNAPAPENLIKVDLTGEVVRPGVYTVAEGMRVEELVKKAGGLRPNADRSKVNFAQKLKDEAKINVPLKPVPKTSSTKSKSNSSKPENAKDSEDLHSAPMRSEYIPKDFKESKDRVRKDAPNMVNVNSASESELAEVPGIGLALAREIVLHRIANGRFATLDDLSKVKGMGGKSLDRIRQRVTL